MKDPRLHNEARTGKWSDAWHPETDAICAVFAAAWLFGAIQWLHFLNVI